MTLGPELSVGFLHYKEKTTAGSIIGVRMNIPWREHVELYLGAGLGTGALLHSRDVRKRSAILSVKVHGGVSMIFDKWPGGFDFGMYWVGEDLSGGASPQGSAFGLELGGYYPFADGRGRVSFTLLPGVGTGRELDVSQDGNTLSIGFREFLLPAMGAEVGISYRF